MHELCKIENVGLRDAAIKILKNDYNINDLVAPKGTVPIFITIINVK